MTNLSEKRSLRPRLAVSGSPTAPLPLPQSQQRAPHQRGIHAPRPPRARRRTPSLALAPALAAVADKGRAGVAPL